jgi:hypothetical protein
MSTSPARRPRVKPARTVNLILAPTATMEGIVRITAGRSCQDYDLARVPADFGAGFRLTKLLGEHDTYHVNLNGQASLCDCLGHTHHGHCKHVDALAALVRAGRLSAGPSRPLAIGA